MRRIVRSYTAPGRAADPVGHLAVRYSHQRWIVDAISASLAEDAATGFGETEAVLAASAGRPRVALCAVPGLAAAQAIGRVGNWTNQELYGEPTDLPWGLRIDPANRLPGLAAHGRFHPTFLYEAVWDVGLAGLLAWLVLRRPPARRPPR